MDKYDCNIVAGLPLQHVWGFTSAECQDLDASEQELEPFVSRAIIENGALGAFKMSYRCAI